MRTGDLFGSRELDELDLPGSLEQVDAGDGDRKVEASGTGATGVDVENVLLPIFVWPMGVTGDDNGDFGEFWVEVDVVQIVEQVDERAFEFDGLAERELRGPVIAVGIAANGEYRSEGFELAEDSEVADVTRVNNEIRSAQGVDSFRAKQAVGVGDDAEEERRHLYDDSSVGSGALPLEALRRELLFEVEIR